MASSPEIKTSLVATEDTNHGNCVYDFGEDAKTRRGYIFQPFNNTSQNVYEV